MLVLLLLLSAVRLSSPVRGVGARGGAGLLPRVRRIGHFSRSRRLTGTSRTRGGRSQRAVHSTAVGREECVKVNVSTTRLKTGASIIIHIHKTH